MFGCAWKINFLEIIFSWLGVLKALTWKWFEVKIFTSNHFRTHAQRERERERERAFDFDFTNFADHSLQLQLRRSTNPWTNLRPRAFDPRAFDFADDPKPLCHEPTNRSLSVCDFDFLCDFDRPMNRSTFLCDFYFLLSLWSLILLLLLWWCG